MINVSIKRSIINAGILLTFLGFTAQPGLASEESEYSILAKINQDYLVSYLSGNVKRFDEILSENFRETAPDGTILDKAAFLEKISKRGGGSQPLTITATELEIRIIGEMAIINAIPVITLADGTSRAGGRYTDVYSRINDRWRCVAAHLGGK